MLRSGCAGGHCVGLCESNPRYLVCEHLEGLDKGPQQDADGVALPQQLDEPSGSEQPQETQVQQTVLLDKEQTYNPCPE